MAVGLRLLPFGSMRLRHQMLGEGGPGDSGPAPERVELNAPNRNGERVIPMTKPALTIDTFRERAASFSKAESTHDDPELFGVTDGKRVGTYLEHNFRAYLAADHSFTPGNSASGIDFPELGVDMKVTSDNQPQSSCPFDSAQQKIYGLGYSLIIFVYEKSDDETHRTGRLNILHAIFVEKERTGDYQMTRGLREIIEREGNVDDLVAFMQDKNLPVDDLEAHNIAKRLLAEKPEQGYLTISNALQ